MTSLCASIRHFASFYNTKGFSKVLKCEYLFLLKINFGTLHVFTMDKNVSVIIVTKV